MAGAEKLIEKIIRDAEQQAEKFASEADVKIREMREELERDLQKQKALMEKEAAEAAQEKKRRLAAVYDLEYRKQLLGAKQEMMSKVKALALEKLAALPDARYLEQMKDRLLKCAASGEGSVIISNTERRLDNAFLADVNSELKKSAGKGELKFAAERRDMLGGFVYVSGGMEINVSLEALLNEAWEESESEVAAILFE